MEADSETREKLHKRRWGQKDRGVRTKKSKQARKRERILGGDRINTRGRETNSGAEKETGFRGGKENGRNAKKRRGDVSFPRIKGSDGSSERSRSHVPSAEGAAGKCVSTPTGRWGIRGEMPRRRIGSSTSKKKTRYSHWWED